MALSPLTGRLVSAGLVLLLPACGSDGGPEAAPAPSSSSSQSPTEPESSLESSPGAEPEPEPEAEPATGPLVRLPVLQVRLPDDTWTPSPVQGGFGAAVTQDGTGQLFVNQFPTLSSNPSLDEAAEIRLQQLRRNESFPVAIGDEITVDGIGAISFEGSGGGTHLFVLETLVLQPEPLALSLTRRGAARRLSRDSRRPPVRRR